MLRPPESFTLRAPLVALLAFAAVCGTAAGAANSGNKEWKGGNGNASNGNNYNTETSTGGGNGGTTQAPGRNDRVKQAGGQMVIDTSLEFGSLEFTGGSITGSSTAPLTLIDTTSDWTGGELTSNAVLNTPGLTIGAGNTKKVTGGAKLNLSGNTAWTGDDIVTGSNAQITNAGTFVASAIGKIGHDATLSGNRAVFKNDGTFTKSSAEGTVEIEATFNNSGTTNVAGGTLKLKGGGSSTNGTLSISPGATVQVADIDYTFTGGNLTGGGTLEIASATATFNGTNGGNAHLKVNGGTAHFQTAHTTTGNLTLSAGTLQGLSATTNTTVGGLQWDAGDISTTGLVTTGSSTIGGLGSKRLTGGAKLTLGGNTTWDGSTINTSGGAAINNAANQTFTVTGDGSILDDSPATPGTFSNAGTFSKSGKSTGATTVHTKFDNTGAVNIGNGQLKLTGGGTSSGNVTIADGAKLEISDANYAFTGGTLGGAGTIEVQGGTTSLAGTQGSANVSVKRAGNLRLNGNHTSTGNLSLTSGTIDGAGTATVGGLAWDGGTITGSTLTAGGATITGNVGKSISGGGQLNLTGNTHWSADPLSGQTATISTSGASTRIKNTGTFTASSDGTIGHTTGADGRATFRNEGTFQKSSTTTGGTTRIEASFENIAGAAVNIDSGSLTLAGGGTSAGQVTLASGTAIVVGGESFAFNGGTLNGSGSIELASATATFNGTTGSANVRIKGGNARFSGTHTTTGNLTLESGSIDGASTATVGALEWSGGSISGATVNASGGLIGGQEAKSIGGGAKLNLGGNTTWSAGNLTTSGAATTITNTGTFAIGGDDTIAHNGTTADRATFRNEGTFHKPNTTSAGTTEVQTKFDNAANGSVQIDGGRFKLTGGGSSAGNVTVASAGTVEISGNDFNFTGGQLQGNGTIEITGAVAGFSGTSGSANLRIGDNGSARFDGTHQGSGRLILESGSLTGAGTAEFGSLDWSGGALNGKVKSTGAVTLGGNSKSLAGELTLGGSTTWDGSLISATGSAKIKNESGQTFLATGDGVLANSGSATFTNAGTFEKNGGHGGVSEIQTRFDSTGTVKAAYGTLKLTGGGSASGNVTIGDSGRIEISGGNGYAFENAALNGLGTIELKGGTTRFKQTGGSVWLALDGGTADLDTTTLTAGALSLTSGSVSSTNGGSADVGWLSWTGGSVNAKVKSASASFNGSSAKSLSSTAELILGGFTSWDGSQIDTHGNAKLRNEADALFLTHADGLLTNSGSAVFTNDGIFIKAGGTGATHLQTRFDNNGIVNVNTGRLQLSGGGRNAAHAQIIIAADAALDISGDLELAANSVLAGQGLGRLLSGTLNANGTISLEKFEFQGGSLAGSHTFTGAVEWSGGNWNSPNAGATTTIAHNGVLNLRSASTHDFSSRTIYNQGTVNWHAGQLRGGNGSSFVNDSIFNDLNAGSKSITSSGGSASFTNNGEYRKSQGGITTVDVPFTNNGSIKVSSGSIVFNSTFTNNGLFNLTNGAQAQFVAPVSFGSSPLTGVGTITATAVTAGGTVAPGVSPGALNITGSLTLLSTSTLLIELAGPTQGTDYDFLGIGGAGVLAGNLNVTFLNGYQWTLPSTATFTILTANGGLTGAFANIANGSRLSTLDGGATFQVNYGLGSTFAQNSVVLSNFIVAVPEPSTYVLMALGGLVLLISLRRRSR